MSWKFNLLADIQILYSILSSNQSNEKILLWCGLFSVNPCWLPPDHHSYWYEIASVDGIYLIPLLQGHEGVSADFLKSCRQFFLAWKPLWSQPVFSSFWNWTLVVLGRVGQLELFSYYTTWGKSRFTVLSTQNTEFILVLFINYRIIFHMNNCKPTFAPPCMPISWFN